MASPHVDVQQAVRGISTNRIVAFAFEDDGWVLRDAIIQHAPKAVPESVRNRLNCMHELIFLHVEHPYTSSTSTHPAPARPHSAGPPTGNRRNGVHLTRHGATLQNVTAGDRHTRRRTSTPGW
jgi:hypothetical protein